MTNWCKKSDFVFNLRICLCGKHWKLSPIRLSRISAPSKHLGKNRYENWLNKEGGCVSDAYKDTHPKISAKRVIISQKLIWSKNRSKNLKKIGQTRGKGARATLIRPLTLQIVWPYSDPVTYQYLNFSFGLKRSRENLRWALDSPNLFLLPSGRFWN